MRKALYEPEMQPSVHGPPTHRFQGCAGGAVEPLATERVSDGLISLALLSKMDQAKVAFIVEALCGVLQS